MGGQSVTVYEVRTDDGSEFFATKAAALRAARDWAKRARLENPGRSSLAEVLLLDVFKPSRDLVIRLLNGRDGAPRPSSFMRKSCIIACFKHVAEKGGAK